VRQIKHLGTERHRTSGLPCADEDDFRGHSEPKAKKSSRSAIETRIWNRCAQGVAGGRAGAVAGRSTHHLFAAFAADPARNPKATPPWLSSLNFEENLGQAGSTDVQYLAHGAPTASRLGRREPCCRSPPAKIRAERAKCRSGPGPHPDRARPGQSKRRNAEQGLPGRSLPVQRPSKWAQTCHYGKVRYVGVYPGVDSSTTGNQGAPGNTTSSCPRANRRPSACASRVRKACARCPGHAADHAGRHWPSTPGGVSKWMVGGARWCRRVPPGGQDVRFKLGVSTTASPDHPIAGLSTELPGRQPRDIVGDGKYAAT